jgi:hypothetical protein
MTLRLDASVRNWRRISSLSAQIAFLIPISFVRSVTDTSIIFITQIPHTSREMAAIPLRSIVSV